MKATGNDWVFPRFSWLKYLASYWTSMSTAVSVSGRLVFPIAHWLLIST